MAGLVEQLPQVVEATLAVCCRYTGHGRLPDATGGEAAEQKRRVRDRIFPRTRRQIVVDAQRYRVGTQIAVVAVVDLAHACGRDRRRQQPARLAAKVSEIPRLDGIGRSRLSPGVQNRDEPVLGRGGVDAEAARGSVQRAIPLCRLRSGERDEASVGTRGITLAIHRAPERFHGQEQLLAPPGLRDPRELSQGTQSIECSAFELDATGGLRKACDERSLQFRERQRA